MPMISAIRQQWHLFAVPADELFGSFFDAMNAFECPFGNSGLPRHMHDTDKSEDRLRRAVRTHHPAGDRTE
ncbi:hypothetical protein F6A45_19235 [Salmonella enterica]|nr:hypothetical protein [Salmonella enterica]